MTVSFMPCCRKCSESMERIRTSITLFVLSICILLLIAMPVWAEGVEIKSVRFSAINAGYEVSVDSEITLNPTLEQALEKGVVLYFVTKFSLIDSRWYWLSDEVARGKMRVGLRYYALTRQFLLNYPSQSQSFNTLAEALQALGQLRDFPLVVKSELRTDVDYHASLRIWLDLTRMPKPFQVEALGSSKWDFSSEKLEWQMKLPMPGQPFQIKAH